jgi:hypothetical protein
MEGVTPKLMSRGFRVLLTMPIFASRLGAQIFKVLLH